MSRAGGIPGLRAGEDVNDQAERERELTLTLKIRTYGSVAQAKATAERVREMLSVELHQDVKLVRRSMKEV